MFDISAVSSLKPARTLVVVGSDEIFPGNFDSIVSHFETFLSEIFD